MLLRYIKGRSSNWICFAGYSIVICLLVILSGFHCFLGETVKNKLLKIEVIESHMGTWREQHFHFFHCSCPSSPTPVDLCEHALHPITPWDIFSTYSYCLCWKVLIRLYIFKEVLQTDSPWPFVSSLTDRQHSPRWKERKGQKRRQLEEDSAITHIHTHTQIIVWLESWMNDGAIKSREPFNQ